MGYTIVPCEAKYAAALAVMWNESMEAWPFGFGGGTSFTEQRVLDWIRDDKAISVELAVADDGRVIGYCQMTQYPREVDAAYISLLNVHPAHHGAKVGKALLKSAVERSIAMRFRRLDLNTWPSNMKAVPLYKKCGFFWVPETTVYMQNYLPLIMQQGPAKDFFARHDWYETYCRCLDVVEDEETWEGLKAFHYAWQSGDETLKVVIDRESRSVTAMETERWSALCRLDDSTPAAGTEHHVLWQVKSHTSEAVPVYLRASGDHELQLHEEVSAQVRGEWIHQAQVAVPANAVPKDEEEPASRLQSLLMIGLQPVNLETGVRVKQPVTLSLYPALPQALFGRKTQGYIRVKNNLDRPLSGRVVVNPDAGLTVECADTRFEVAPKGMAGVPVSFTTLAPGVYHLNASVVYDDQDSKKRSRVEPLPVPGVPLGGVVSSVEEKYGLIETEDLRIQVWKRGGRTFFIDRMTGSHIGFMTAEMVGPPFWPSEFEAMTLEVLAEQGGLKVIARSQEHPGLVLEKTIRANAGPIIGLSYRVYNHGDKPMQFQLGINPATEFEQRRVALPTKQGLILEDQMAGEFPGEDDLSKRPEDWSETWSSAEGDGHTVGVMWQGPMAEAGFMTWFGLVCPVIQLPELQPGTSVQTGDIYLYVGRGGYQAVRGYWRTLIGGKAGTPIATETRPVFEVSFGGPLIIQGAETESRLTAVNSRRQPWSGTLELHLPQGWQTGQDRFELTDINMERSFEGQVRIGHTGGSDRAGMGAFVLRNSGGTFRRTFGCIQAGDGREAIVEKQDGGKWQIVNGYIRLKVDEAFNGSCHTLEVGGHNHLFSAHPTPGTFKSMKPWYGGIYPAAYNERGQVQLYRDPHVSEAVSRKGLHGWTWRGVKTSVVSHRKESEGLVISTEFLTLGGSNILAVVAGVTNPSAAPVRLMAGAASYLQPGGRVGDAVLHFELGGREHHRTREAGYTEAQLPWAAVENAGNGWTLLGLAPQGLFTVIDRTDAGAHLLLQNDIEVGPGQTVEKLYYLIVLEHFDQYRPYLELLKVSGLV